MNVKNWKWIFSVFLNVMVQINTHDFMNNSDSVTGTYRWFCEASPSVLFITKTPQYLVLRTLMRVTKALSERGRRGGGGGGGGGGEWGDSAIQLRRSTLCNIQPKNLGILLTVPDVRYEDCQSPHPISFHSRHLDSQSAHASYVCNSHRKQADILLS